MELYKKIFNCLTDCGKIDIYSYQYLYLEFSKDNSFENRFSMSCLDIISKGCFNSRSEAVAFCEHSYNVVKK